MTLSPIPLFVLGLMRKFSNPAFHPLIKSMDSFLRIEILPFLEKRQLIMG